MKKTKFAVIVLVTALVLLLAVVGYDYLSENYVPAENESTAASSENVVMAPEFTVYDGDGNPVNFSDFSGKPVVILFWATWCTYCQMEMEALEKAYATFGDEVMFMAINVTDGIEETVESAKAFVEKKGHTFPVYFDTDLNAAGVYGASSLPATVFINAAGEFVYGQLGYMDEEKLSARISEIIG